jgi:hypothetical protein
MLTSSCQNRIRPQLPFPPAPLRAGDGDVINYVVGRFYGEDAVIRNYGPDPERLLLHVETSCDKHEWAPHDCLGALFTRIDRKQIDLIVTKRGWAPSGLAKIAYRQGIVV